MLLEKTQLSTSWCCTDTVGVEHFLYVFPQWPYHHYQTECDSIKPQATPPRIAVEHFVKSFPQRSPAEAVVGPLLVQPQSLDPHPCPGYHWLLCLKIFKFSLKFCSKSNLKRLTVQVQIRLYNYLSTDFLADTQVKLFLQAQSHSNLIWSDLLKCPPSLDGAADDAHVEVLLLGGEAGEGERGLSQGARHQPALGSRHRHHQVWIFLGCHLCQMSVLTMDTLSSFKGWHHHVFPMCAEKIWMQPACAHIEVQFVWRWSFVGIQPQVCGSPFDETGS